MFVCFFLHDFLGNDDVTPPYDYNYLKFSNCNQLMPIMNTQSLKHLIKYSKYEGNHVWNLNDILHDIVRMAGY